MNDDEWVAFEFEMQRREAWDRYAAATLHCFQRHPEYAAQVADQMLAERNKRFPPQQEKQQ
jgi:hypothetical protein